MKQNDNKEIISFLKEKGFVFPGSDIYGGMANSWDYGPLGSILKSNIKDLWKTFFVDQQKNVFHLDSSIMLNTKVWEASGHLSKFNDPMVDCKKCKKRFRADHLIEQATKIEAENKTFNEMDELIKNIKCPSCNEKDWTNVRNFDLMFKFDNSKTGDGTNIYLRPETAQGVFINYLNILNSMNPKLPFGIAQIGKAFRNEVTPGNFIFRTKEFEQLELEFFINPENEEISFEIYLKLIRNFLSLIGLKEKNIKELEVSKENLAHYSKRTIDFEYNFPFGWGEILGLANRQQFDLKNHSQHSGKKLISKVNEDNESIIPSVIESSFGVERLFYAIISECYTKEKLKENDERINLKLPYSLAPYKLAVAPLTNKLSNEAEELYESILKQNIGPITFTSGGSIGKRYRKQDAIGTPFVITYDFDSIDDDSVTIRTRDDMSQKRIFIKDIKNYILENAK